MLFWANSDTCLLNVVYTTAEPIATSTTTTTKCTNFKSYLWKQEYSYCKFTSTMDYS